MIRRWLLLTALMGLGLQQVCADTIELKDKAAIVGKVLAEKPDQIAVDVGYTVLVIPRSQVVKVERSDAPAAPPGLSLRRSRHPPPGPGMPPRRNPVLLGAQ